jgi:hypothetical protein
LACGHARKRFLQPSAHVGDVQSSLHPDVGSQTMWS